MGMVSELLYGYYLPVLLLQGFCIYHAYRNNADQRWYWFILLFPVIGAGFYLYHHFYSRRNLNSITEGVKELVNSNYKIEQLEKAFRFSDNLTNRLNLADAYVSLQRYEEAIGLYKEGLTGIMADDPALKMKLLHTCFLHKNYKEAIALGESLEKEKKFKDATERISFAWSLYLDQQPEQAEKVFLDMNKANTNFTHRVEYARFLIETSKSKELESLLSELLEEFDHLKGPQRKFHRATINTVKDLYQKQVTKNG